MQAQNVNHNLSCLDGNGKVLYMVNIALVVGREPVGLDGRIRMNEFRKAYDDREETEGLVERDWLRDMSRWWR
jgi:hypothetical protein